MFCDTNDGGVSPFFNLSFNNTPNANEKIVVILNYSFNKESDADESTFFMVFSNQASSLTADEWLVVGNTFTTGTFNSIPTRTCLTGGAGCVNFQGQNLNNPYQRWAFVYNVTNGTMSIWNESSQGSGIWVQQTQNTASNADKMVQVISLFDQRPAGGAASHVWFSNIQMINDS